MNTKEIQRSLQLLSEEAFSALRQIKPRVREATVGNILKAKKLRRVADEAKLAASKIKVAQYNFDGLVKRMGSAGLHLDTDGAVSLDWNGDTAVDTHIAGIRSEIQKRIDAFYIALPRLSPEQRAAEYDKIVEFIGERTPTEDSKIVGLPA